VVDTSFIAPALTTGGYPGPDGPVQDPTSGSNGLSTIPDELIAELPEDCRREFERAREEERLWKEQWGNEGRSGCRPGGGLKIGFVGMPV
jgi:chromatin structure-remodeling complex protein RSC7